MTEYHPAKKRVAVSVGESVGILRELQELSQTQLEKLTKAALSSYVATQEIIGDVMDIPEFSFASTYIASHYGLGLVDEHLGTTLMEYMEGNLKGLLDLINKYNKIQK